MPRVKSYRYRSTQFFSGEFAFSFHRMWHSPDNINAETLHRRDFWKVIYIVKGRGWKVINGQRYPLRPGGLFLVHPEDETTFIIESRNIEICNILFMPEILGDGLDQLRDEFSFFSILRANFRKETDKRESLYILDSDREIKRLVSKLEHEYEDRSANFQVLIKLNLLELLIRLGRKASSKARKKSRSGIIEYVEHVIAQHYSAEFDLGTLARNVGMQKSSLCRMFKQKTGKTITERLLEERLAVARRLLSDPEMNIAGACYSSGFNDLSYFYRTFKKHTGDTPGDYRKRIGLD